MLGKPIVFEGLDGAGKSTLIEFLKPQLQAAYYSRGFTLYHKFIHKVIFHLPSFWCYVDFLFQTYVIIFPRMIMGKTVVTDRYYQSVDIFFPDCSKLQNRIFTKLFKPLFLKADLYVYVTVSDRKRIRRLKERPTRPDWEIEEDTTLAKHRAQYYQDIFSKLKGNKLLVNTTEESIENNVENILAAMRDIDNEG